MAARKTIIVTGASRGIGHATAMRFHSEGWRVLTVSRTPPPGQCPWSQERSHILLDLADLANIVHCTEVMRGMLEGGELHALVNNAGISPKGPDGNRLVRVNAISPGEIDTAILSPGTDKIVAEIPLQRLGTPDEVAKIIYVLCTETSSYVNGAEIHINGGQHV
jgi:NAD(P)-dependent dehydrogenase (short-subunit alcohol dehydrogenase family)